MDAIAIVLAIVAAYMLVCAIDYAMRNYPLDDIAMSEFDYYPLPMDKVFAPRAGEFDEAFDDLAVTGAIAGWVEEDEFDDLREFVLARPLGESYFDIFMAFNNSRIGIK